VKLRGTKASWQVRPVDATGQLDLSSLLPKGRTAAYAVLFVHSPTRQQATLHLTADDAVRVVVGRKSVFESPPPIIPYPRPVDTTIPVDLQTGWTPVVIKLVTTGKEHRLGLRVKGENLRISARPVP
jgi:hypothetical protein